MLESSSTNYWGNLRRAQCKDSKWQGSCYAKVVTRECARCKPSNGGPCGSTYADNPRPCTDADKTLFDATPMVSTGGGLSAMTPTERKELATGLSEDCLACVLYANKLHSKRGGDIIGSGKGVSGGYCMSATAAGTVTKDTPCRAGIDEGGDVILQFYLLPFQRNSGCRNEREDA